MTKKRTIQKAKTLLEKIDSQKKVLAADRDKLRDLYEDLGSIVESVGTGIDEIEDGLRSLQSGLDSMSQYL